MIEVFADVVCPFTHVGLRRLVTRRDDSESAARLHVRSWPLELVNDEPTDPGSIAEKVAALRDSVAGDLFSGFNPRRFPTSSLPALELTAEAYKRSLATGETVALRLRDLLFEQGVDVSDPAVLARVARAHRLPAGGTAESSAVEADFAEGRRRGVRGSPHFFLDGDDVFCPSLEIAHDAQGLRIEFDQRGFDRFAQRALQG